MKLGSFWFNQPFGFSGSSAAAVDALQAKLIELEAAGKLVAAWYLPLADPDQHLTLNGAAVEGWAAAYGTQKVTPVNVTTPPSWDATRYGGRGAVVFDGTDDQLTGGGNVSNWPADTEDLYMLYAGTGGASSGARTAFSYGSAVTTSSRVVGAVATDAAQLRVSAANGGAGTVGTAGTVGAFINLGGTSDIYVNGVDVGDLDTSGAQALTRTRTRIGASCAAGASNFFLGDLAAVAILNSTAVLADFLALEVVMRARVT